MAIDPVTAVSNAIVEVAKIIAQAFNGENRRAMLEVKEFKNKVKACNIAEDIFRITDNALRPEENYKEYWSLRKDFDRKD